MCAVDLNADGLSDLLVGAPMATGITREEGRVHVYINQGQVGAHHRYRFDLLLVQPFSSVQTRHIQAQFIRLTALQLLMCDSYHIMWFSQSFNKL